MGEDPGSTNDGLFRVMLEDLESAEVFLAERLPEPLNRCIVPGSLERLDDTFIDDELRRHHADVIYKLRLRLPEGAERQVVAIVLFEHKSAPDRLAALQLLRYLQAFWTRWIERKLGLPLPPVLTVLVHQGPPRWPYPGRLLPLFEPLPGALADLVPDFPFAIIDLFILADDGLSRHRRLKAMLLALKYARRRELASRLAPIAEAVLKLSPVDLTKTLVYLEGNRVGVSAEAIHAALMTAKDEKGADDMGVIDIIEARGEARGEARAKAAALRKVLSSSFGPLPSAISAAIDEADTEQIDRWFDAALAGARLPELFPAAV